MFNIIEQQVKLNMKTETKEERTPKVAECKDEFVIELNGWRLAKGFISIHVTLA